MISIFIDTPTSASAEPSRRVAGLPATIGRGIDCTVRLDIDSKAVSRNHLEVVEENGRAVVVNRASNPGTSRHDGRVLDPGERLPIAAGEVVSIDILGRIVTIGYASPLVLRVRDGDGPAAEFDLDTRVVILSIDGFGRRVASVDPTSTDGTVTGAGIALFRDHGQPALARLAGAESMPVTIDNALCATATAYLRPLETVCFAGFSCELVEMGRPVARCATVSCCALNEPGRERCRVCSGRLAAALAPALEMSAPASVI